MSVCLFSSVFVCPLTLIAARRNAKFCMEVHVNYGLTLGYVAALNLVPMGPKVVFGVFICIRLTRRAGGSKTSKVLLE